ncbi:MAG: MBL fold metallo-hydrolase [bacterium]|jgi:glyoxylase-like metal-dependent hydrolase (beta-lactamase superfamily II)
MEIIMGDNQQKGKEVVVERLEVGPLLTNCYILKSGEEMVVIDPGADGAQIVERVKRLGGTVKYVINTHGHIDHIGANGEVVNATGAGILIHELDFRMLAEPDLNLSILMGVSVSSPLPARLLRDGDEIEVGAERLRVVHTPGHTPGSICLIGDGFAFTGDTLFLDSIGRVDLPGGSELAMRQSISRLELLLRREMMLYPGHGMTGSFGRALLVNPFLGGSWTV